MKKILLVSAFAIVCLGSLLAQEKIATEISIPIVAWSSIPANETTVEKFTELKEMGININLCNYPNAEAMQKALDIAKQVGLKMITSCPELKTDCENTVKKFMNHPALAGYFLRDEPIQKDFAELGEWAKKIKSIDKNHFCFVNLIAAIHPTKTEALGTNSYAEYIRTFVGTVPLQQISYDFYPVLNEGIHERWYEGLEIVTAESRKLGLPFWAFALASSYNELHPEPSIAALRLQMFSNLAYGAQGLEYWSYRMSPGLRSAPVGLDGKRTLIYDRIKQVNSEIQAFAGVFAGAKVVSVNHTGTVIPRGTSRLTTLPQAIKVFENDGDGALVSTLENGDKTYFLVINRNLGKSMSYIIFGDDSLRKVLKDGTIISAGSYSSRSELEPGDMAVYLVPTQNKEAK
jgi:sugar phosphate isomerase/epimerase